VQSNFCLGTQSPSRLQCVCRAVPSFFVSEKKMASAHAVHTLPAFFRFSLSSPYAHSQLSRAPLPISSNPESRSLTLIPCTPSPTLRCNAPHSFSLRSCDRHRLPTLFCSFGCLEGVFLNLLFSHCRHDVQRGETCVMSQISVSPFLRHKFFYGFSGPRLF